MVLAVGVFSTDKEAQCMWRARLWSLCPTPVKMAAPPLTSLQGRPHQALSCFLLL